MFNSKLYYNFIIHHSRNLNGIFNAVNHLQKPVVRKNLSFSSPKLSQLHVQSRTYASASKRSVAVTVSKPVRKTEPAELKQGKFKTYTPRTPGLRWLKRPVNDHLWKGKPIRKLTIPKREKSGRNIHGHITV